MMGAGKSSVGHCLQEQTGFSRFDTDELVAAEFGLPIPEIFIRHGEGRFREAETEVLRKLRLPYPIIVVTGGGTVCRDENVDLVKRLGTVVWLAGDEATLFERAMRSGTRPLLKTEDPRAEFDSLLRQREVFYEQAADLRVDISELDEHAVADAILDALDWGTTRSER